MAFAAGAFFFVLFEAAVRMPRLERVLSEMLHGEALPGIVTAAIETSRFVQDYWWMAALLILLFGVVSLWKKGRGITLIWIVIGVFFALIYAFLLVGRVVGTLRVKEIHDVLLG